MDGFGELRALVLELNFSAHGFPVTVTPVSGPEVETRGIWLTNTLLDVPGSAEFHRREIRRVIALSKTDVPMLPRGSLVIAPERAGSEPRQWRVDGVEGSEADHQRVVVIHDEDLS
jgi:hypothetical protein